VTHPHSVRKVAIALALTLASGCGTVDLGENIVQPNGRLDEEFFYCVIQPDVIQAASCATGAAGDTGGCHASQSALRLSDTTSLARPDCVDGELAPGAVVPLEYTNNFQSVQFTLGPDAESSPFYRRPTMMDSHPRRVVDMAQEDLILQWFARGTL
jgi:hypothetical protein